MFPDGIAQLTAPRPPANRHDGSRSVLCISLLCLLLSRKLDAQMPQDSNTPPAEQILASYEGQTVTSIDIAGRPT